MPRPELVLWNASIIDCRTPHPVERTRITMRGGRIEQVGNIEGSPPPDAIDLGGRFVLPGLIDAHIHLAHDPKILDAAAPSRPLRPAEPPSRQLGCFAPANA